MADPQTLQDGHRLAFHFSDVLTVPRIYSVDPPAQVDTAGVPVQPAPNNLQALSPWEIALAQAHLRQGDGTPDSPFYVGAQHLTTAPALISPTIAPSRQTSIARVQRIQQKLVVAFQAVKFAGLRQHRAVTMKLHPWAVIGWVNVFTGLIFSSTGVSNINAISSAARTAAFRDRTELRDNHAFERAGRMGIPRQECLILYNLAQLADAGSQIDSFSQYARLCARVGLFYSVEDFTTEVQDNPQGAAATSLNGRQPVNGLPVRSRVLTSCAMYMGRSPREISDELHKDANRALAVCTGSLTGGFLLFVGRAMLNNMIRDGEAATPALLPIVREHFPELAIICGQIYNTLGRALMSPNPHIRNRVVGQQVPTTAGGMDMVSRIRAAIG